MTISIIATVGENNLIGVNHEIPWLIHEDLKHFRLMTMGKTVVMGWKTWEAFNELPLYGCNNIVVSRRKKYIKRNKNVKLINDPMEATKLSNDILIIGGESLYRYFLPLANMMYITKVYTKITTENEDVVTRFPNFTDIDWKLISGDYRSEFCINFMTYENINLTKSL